jgi:ubiquinone/menaquinone biosynthesis C-methylase UbiE
MRIPNWAGDVITRLSKAGYHLLYHQLAWSYDLVAWLVSSGQWKKWVLAALPFLETGDRILELGYGPGHLQAALAERNIKAIGLDASLQMARLAHQNLKRQRVYPRLILGYAQSLPFLTSSFALVVATFPSEYILDPVVLNEIHRILLPRGELLVIPYAFPTKNHRYERWNPFLRIITTSDTTGWSTPFLAPFMDAGFTCELITRQVDGSAVMVIRAKIQGENLSSATGS